MLFSAYRTDQYADPEGFLNSLGLVLEQYPNEVVIWVTDPRTGIQRGKVFPPAIAEIVAACDAKVADIARVKRYQNWGKSEPNELLEAPGENRPTLEQLQAKYGKDWGLTPNPDRADKPTWKAPTKEELLAHYREYGLQFRPKQQDAAE